MFLLPGINLPPNTAASVYIAIIPPAGAASATANDFKFLGGIGPGKESAIFKFNNGSASNGIGSGGEFDMDMNGASSTVGAKEIILGISLESADEVSSKMAALQSTTNSSADQSTALVTTNKQPTKATTVVLAQRIIKNAFNFLASFAGNVPVPGGSGTAGVEVVPLKAFQDWWGKFENKIKNDPGFLERDVD